jgi:NifU-like protein involved in Fe-S cluster formation
MAQSLYNSEILRLATEIPHQHRLDAPQASVRKVSPICGSRVIVDMDVFDGHVVRFGQEVNACALGQASAAILGQHILGRTAAELRQAREALSAFLKGHGPAPSGDFSALEIFTPAISYRSRHGAIMLPFDAAAEAAENLEASRASL